MRSKSRTAFLSAPTAHTHSKSRRHESIFYALVYIWIWLMVVGSCIPTYDSCQMERADVNRVCRSLGCVCVCCLAMDKSEGEKLIYIYEMCAQSTGEYARYIVHVREWYAKFFAFIGPRTPQSFYCFASYITELTYRVLYHSSSIHPLSSYPRCEPPNFYIQQQQQQQPAPNEEWLKIMAAEVVFVLFTSVFHVHVPTSTNKIRSSMAPIACRLGVILWLTHSPSPGPE